MSAHAATIGFVKRFPTSPQVESDQNLKPIDDLLEVAGLVRNRRKSPPGITSQLRNLRQDAATKQELAGPAPLPRLLKNGVGLLQIPDWRDQKTTGKWLWHGFSTRVGGMSRAYCAEESPGELNLGFTAADDREAVVKNRQLLAEAVTGDKTTPIVTVRQFHSNLW